jgi:CubicO group peptidase (beta-lactamase class C family)
MSYEHSTVMRCAALLLCALPAIAAEIPAAAPESVGVSTERLARIHEAMIRHVEAGSISGAVTLVARRGRVVHFEAHGLMDLESRKPMAKDAVFRLASMSKPVTAVAVLTLIEEGKIRLTDPVSKYIPEFKEMKVAVPMEGPAAGGGGGGRGAVAGAPGRGAVPRFYAIPAAREITIFDLLTHTSGVMSGPISSSEANRIAPRKPTDTLADYIPRIAAAPLEFQPGSQWAYSGLAGPDILSRIVEIVSGQTYDQFLKTRIFDPLGMKDTGFWPYDTAPQRIVTLYQRSPNGLQKNPNQQALSSKTYFSGAAGLTSTAEDYLQFAQMLLNGGVLNGRRILGPKTVELMASNHVGDMFNGKLGRPAHGMGFGFLVSVIQDSVAAGLRVSNGSFGWDGAFGTQVWIDPKEKMVTIVMIQTQVPLVQRDFENAVMQALID